MLNKDKLIKGFCNGLEKGKGSHLEIIKNYDKTLLFNYSTIIAVRDANGTIFLNTIKYSRTTSRNQNLIKLYASNIVEVDNEVKLFNIAMNSN